MADRRKTDERKEKKARLKDTTKNRNFEHAAHRILMIGFVVILIFIVIKGIFSFIDLKAQQNEVEEKYANMLAEKEELQETLVYINTPEYIEKTARDMLKMVMPGEILYVLKDGNTENSTDEEDDH
ncbi:MAG: septum formation initiator family protein [Firmicutes bacterium]|nr:septum formation initiator family protein [Bacillota bacterium]